VAAQNNAQLEREIRRAKQVRQPRRPSPSPETQTAELTVGKSKTVGDITIRVESVVLGANEKKVVLTVAGKDGEPETRTLAENEAMHFGGIEIAPEAILAGDEGRGRAKLKISRSTSRPERGNR
jgi:hypothetical protein